MPSVRTDISPFLLHNPQSSNEEISLLVSHPSPQELQSLGRLFMLLKLSPANEQTKKIIGTIEQEGKLFYYQQLESNVELAFETTLKKINELLSNYLEHVSAEWLNDFNAIIGVIRGSDMYFAQVGNFQAFLIHRMRVVNILEKTKGAETRINPLKIFSQTISGQLNPDDALVFCTSTVLDYLSLERLRTIIQSSPTSQAALTLENLLMSNSDTSGFAALLIKLVPETIAVPSLARTSQPGYSRGAPQESMEQLRSRESSTTELLAPSSALFFKNLFRRAGDRIGKISENIGLKPKISQRHRPTEVQYYAPVRESYKQSRRPRYSSRFVYVLGRILTGLQLTANFLKRMFLGLFGVISGRKNITQKLQHLPTNASTSVSKQIVFFQKLTRRRKVLLLVFVLIIFIFAQSVIIINRNKETKKQLATYQDSLNQATTKEQDAEAAMLYGDENNTRTLLKQATDLIASIPEKEREHRYQAEIAGLMTKIDSLALKTKHINTIAEPTLLADLATAGTEVAAGGLAGIFGSDIVAYSTNKSELYQVNVDEKKPASIAFTEAKDQTVRFSAPLSNNTALLYLSNDTLLQYKSTDDSFTALTIDFENQDRTLAGMASYLDRIYTLDTKNNQIFRHQKSGNQYQKGASWLTQAEADVKNGVDLAIDGSVFVLRSDGQLTKFVQGATDTSFSLNAIDPAISSPTKLWLDVDTTYLYILEPSQKRLLVFTKTGKLKNQYASNAFDNLLDMAINEKDKKAYLLNGTKIFGVDLLE
ncbi:MAG: hypothetical protein PHI73_01715 [Patescibacteria group bacterium]|nr:hypothetical protein [Patescibacteria group bacterium]